MSTAMSKSKQRVQANIDPQLKSDAEYIIDEVGLTPTAVINGLYREIVATGKIPLSFSLTPEQRTDMAVRQASEKVPVRKLRSKKEIEDFFNED